MASNEKQNPGVPPSFIYSRTMHVRLVQEYEGDPMIVCDKDVLNQSSTLPLHLKCLLFKAIQEGHPESVELCYYVPDEEPIIPIRSMQRFVDKYVKKSYDPGVDEEHKKLIGRMPTATSKAITEQDLIEHDPGVDEEHQKLVKQMGNMTTMDTIVAEKPDFGMSSVGATSKFPPTEQPMIIRERNTELEKEFEKASVINPGEYWHALFVSKIQIKPIDELSVEFNPNDPRDHPSFSPGQRLIGCRMPNNEFTLSLKGKKGKKSKKICRSASADLEAAFMFKMLKFYQVSKPPSTRFTFIDDQPPRNLTYQEVDQIATAISSVESEFFQKPNLKQFIHKIPECLPSTLSLGLAIKRGEVINFANQYKDGYYASLNDNYWKNISERFDNEWFIDSAEKMRVMINRLDEAHEKAKGGKVYIALDTESFQGAKSAMTVAQVSFATTLGVIDFSKCIDFQQETAEFFLRLFYNKNNSVIVHDALGGTDFAELTAVIAKLGIMYTGTTMCTVIDVMQDFKNKYRNESIPGREFPRNDRSPISLSEMSEIAFGKALLKDERMGFWPFSLERRDAQIYAGLDSTTLLLLAEDCHLEIANANKPYIEHSDQDQSDAENSDQTDTESSSQDTS